VHPDQATIESNKNKAEKVVEVKSEECIRYPTDRRSRVTKVTDSENRFAILALENEDEYDEIDEKPSRMELGKPTGNDDTPESTDQRSVHFKRCDEVIVHTNPTDDTSIDVDSVGEETVNVVEADNTSKSVSKDNDDKKQELNKDIISKPDGRIDDYECVQQHIDKQEGVHIKQEESKGNENVVKSESHSEEVKSTTIVYGLTSLGQPTTRKEKVDAGLQRSENDQIRTDGTSYYREFIKQTHLLEANIESERVEARNNKNSEKLRECKAALTAIRKKRTKVKKHLTQTEVFELQDWIHQTLSITKRAWSK